ncbi:MAG: efflux RND transporter permease subunit [Leptospiraceae bacterium]|nr:efflux RND transporter permease subunit [Leptospiraceae bacterium]
MIKRIITFSANNRALVLFLTLVATLGAWYATKTIRLDALPDLSDTQVILYARWDRSPDVVEAQITTPIVRTLMGAPKVKSIRAVTDYGTEFVYVIFEDQTDLYWARSRITEYMSRLRTIIPADARLEIGPDATGLGWVYQYVVKDETGKSDLERLRALQDFTIRYQLLSVPGVAEVASVGGFQKQYQITLDPVRLRASGISLNTVIEKVRASNAQAGARLLEINGAEYMIRSQGYIKSKADLGDIGIGSDEAGNAVMLRSVATINEAPALRRGVTDFIGQGDAVSGVVVMRQNENAYEVIGRVKERVEEVRKFLPPGITLMPVYDRSELIEHSIANLRIKLIEEMLIVAFVILIFLGHFPSAIVPILTIPIAVLISFIPLNLFGVSSNLMSLAGIAISIGVLVDGAIVEVENAYKKLEEWQRSGMKEDYHKVRLEALLEVGPSVFFSLLVVAVAFLPIFTLVDQEGRLFKPLAYSKNLAMAVAAFLAITVDPAMRMLFTRMQPYQLRNARLTKIVNTLAVGKYHAEENHPISKRLIALYAPVCRYTLEHPKRIIGAALVLMLSMIPLYMHLGQEFFPALYEESLLYMPVTAPGLSASEAARLLKLTDQIIASHPEVERVFGKAGRADSATDPAPLSMFETNIMLKPRSQWTVKSKEELIAKFDASLKIPGLTNAFTMPIRARVDMLSTGMRTPLGLKIHGRNVHDIDKTAVRAEQLIKALPGVRSAVAERAATGYYIDIEPRRPDVARYALSIDDVQMFVRTALGGEELTQTIEGTHRYAVIVRYAPDWRNSVEKLKRAPLPIPGGGQVPLSAVADVSIKREAGMIRNENGFLTGYVFIDTSTADLAGLAQKIDSELEKLKPLPDSVAIALSGQYENIQRVRDRLKIVIPVTLMVIVFLLFFNTKSWVKTGIVMLAVPFSMLGALLLLTAMGVQISVAVWVGLIALMGLDAETGVFMLMYLDLAYEERKKKIHNERDLKEAVFAGAVHRLRPKMMTVLAAFCGLLPIMFSSATGSDVMKAIAAPLVGGLFTSFILELVIYPPVYFLWKKRKLLVINNAELIPAAHRRKSD